MNEVTFKRKFRWTLEANLPGGRIEPIFVKVAARPNLNIEEAPIGPCVVPKSEWEQITITIYGLDGWKDDKKEDFWKIIAHGWQPDTQTLEQGEFKIVLYDGCGFALEEWELKEAYITAIDFSELDHSSSEQVDIELTIKYKAAIYKNLSTAENPRTHPAYSGTNMGIGQLGTKVKCPKCEHDFTVPSWGSNIIY